MGCSYVKLVIVRAFLSLILVASTAFAFAQFKVDPQKIPVVQAKRRALIIGASDYQTLGKLTYASSDAERFRDALMTGYKFTDDSIHFISDAPTSLEKPTASTILHALNQMLADPVLDKGDLFILFFSGHGMATGGRDFLCATDTKVSDVQTTGLPVNEVIQKLVDAKLRNVVIIADACRAGDKNDFGSELYDQAKKANIAILLGCEPGKKSYEVPQLRSGAFTYFLLKALSNPKNRTESGGLWMSKVAENTEANVFEYTAHDYGDNAQRPKSFADPTSDVMLAKFINRPDPTKPEGKNVDLEMVNDPRKNSDQMLETSLQYILKDDYTRSLEASKQALSLNSQNYLAAYYAALASSRLGRSGEQEKYCDFLKKLDDPYYRSLGYVSSDSRATPIPDRIKALETFWESSPKDIVHALIVWGKARTYLPMMITKVLIQKMLPDIKAGSRVAAFFEGEIAVADGQLETALAKYRTAITRADFSEFLSDEELTVIQFPLAKYWCSGWLQKVYPTKHILLSCCFYEWVYNRICNVPFQFLIRYYGVVIQLC